MYESSTSKLHKCGTLIPKLYCILQTHLHVQIRVLGFTRVTSGFEARKHCDCRRYEYVLPAAAFDPAWPGAVAGQPDQANAAQPTSAAAGRLPLQAPLAW